MSEHIINVPKIRFPGFADAWEQRRLVDVADYRNGKAHEQEINEDGEYIVVNSKFVSTDGRVKKYSNALIEPLKTGEIAFVLSDVPNGKAIARTFLVDENNKYSLNQRIAGITPHEDTDSYFLSVLMNRNNYFLKFDNGVGQTNLSKSEVENFSERYPSYEEQVKVGTLFRNLDSLITIHQRKLNHLQERKKGLLQKMFPKNGEDFPELRFPGYTEAWEQQKFSDMLDSSDGIRRGPFGSALKKDFFVPESVLDGVFISDSSNNMVGGTGSLDANVIATFEQPFSPHGGTKVLSGNLGRAVMKTSAVPEENQIIEAPAVVFESQHDVLPAFDAGLLDKDCVVVVRHQGPKANGMPELHKLMPPLGVLLDRRFKIALVTDGRLSGASGKVPSAIHVTPEAYDGGLLAKVRDGDIIRVNGQTGELTLLVDEVELAARKPHIPDLSASRVGTGREMFGALREKLSGAEQGATCITF